MQKIPMQKTDPLQPILAMRGKPNHGQSAHFRSYPQSLQDLTNPNGGFKVKLRRGRLRVQYTDNPWEMHLLSGRDRNFLGEWLQVCPAGSIYLDPRIGASTIEMWSELALKYGKKSFLTIERTRQLPQYKYPRQWLVKRCLDWLVAGGLLLLLSPLWLILMLWLRNSNHRQIITREWSVGGNGKIFPAYKFNLEPNGELDLELPENRGFRLRIERWLHHLGIHRLPLLLNVLRGDISLLGRNPRQVVDVLAMPHSERRYLNIVPGIFGIYKPCEQQDCRRIHSQELEYLRTWNLRKDMQIFAETAWKRILNK